MITGTKYNIYHCGLVFIVVFLVYITSPVITVYDSRWTVHTSLSIIHQGNTDLNEYNGITTNDYRIEKIGNSYYSIFPIGTSLLSVPFVAIADAIFESLMNRFPALEKIFKQKLESRGIHVESLQLTHFSDSVERVIASFFCALTAVIIFLIARINLPTYYALLIVFIFSFCTSSWSTSSRALWQHGPSMLMLAYTLYLIIIEDKQKSSIHLVAIPLALAFVIRPTNVIPIVFISMYILIYHRYAFIKYVLLATPFAILFFMYNISIYDNIIPNYVQPNRVFHLKNFTDALAGNLISPSRGLFIYSPIFLLSMLGFILSFYSKNNSIAVMVMGVIITHWFLISSFPHWWGGHSYGPRFFSDMIPFFIYLIILVFTKISSYRTTKKLISLLAIVPLITLSFYANYKGAYTYAVYEWNAKPTNIDRNPDRLWDWNDMQMLR